jgi:tetratricopeptide (TPR) repeat protein
MATFRVGSLVLCTFGLGGLAGAFAVARTATRPAAPEGDGARRLARTLEALAADVDTMRQRVAQLEQRPEGAARLPDRVEQRAGARDAVRDGDAAAPRAAPAPADPEAEKRAALAAATARLEPKFEALLRAGLPAKELAQLLREAAAAGEDDAAIAALLALVERDPDDAHARYALAKAYCTRVMRESTPAGYEKWGGLALDAWQKAADLDPHYWEPRFERAEYLTYYPESEGRTPEVIASLEGLVTLQGGSNSNPRFARTYAHLSRMYLRVGNRDKALQTLRDGLALFPEDPELSGQLKVLKQE